MKEIIDGVRYDTEKATDLGWVGNDEFANDMRHWSGRLYRTPRSGRYFIAGKGGAMSRFAVPCPGGGSGGGSGIQPISEREALRLAEDCWSSDAIEEAFGHLIDDA
jgi:hypothetical protein